MLASGVTHHGKTNMSMGDLQDPIYPLVMTNIAIENGHRNSGFSH
jgi:hypothetical protein